jgi:hypothetical protein
MYRGVWPYYASFAAHVWLYAGRSDKAIDYLYAFANHAAATRVWREEQAFTGPGREHDLGDMPHNWASAEFIRLVRDLLVFEVRDGVELLPGLPPEWIADGSRTHVDATPTAFGPVSMTVEARESGGRVELVFEEPDRIHGDCVLHVPTGEWHLDIRAKEKAAMDVVGPTKIQLTR